MKMIMINKNLNLLIIFLIYNYKIIFCVEIVKHFKNYKNNIGVIISSIIFFINIIFTIVFFSYDLRKIRFNIYKDIQSNIKLQREIIQKEKEFLKAEKELSDFYVTIIEEELNVKKLTFTQDTSDFTTYSFKPQLRTVGPKYGKVLGQIKEYLSNVNGDEAMAELKSKGAITFTAGDTEVSLAEEDLLIETEEKGGFVTEADNKVTVVLDTNLTDELIKEGFVYEVISKIQNMRKDSGFEVMDHIRLAVNGNDKIAEVIKESESDISTKVLAETVLYGEVIGNAKEWNINGEKVTLSLEKV